MSLQLNEGLGTREVGPDDWPREVTADVAYLRTLMVNVVFVGLPGSGGDRDWVLIDAGLGGSASAIAAAAERRFGPRARPAAIVLTHGHFDHVGALETLAKAWDVPVFAHELELPYLTGESPYPPPDPTVGGGLIAAMSWLFPRGPYDFRDWIRVLPAGGAVPGMPGWRWVHTPGHAPGHISLFRDLDRVLIVGDAFVTTKQESASAVLTQKPEIHGPPAYYTIDWAAAWKSVRKLEALDPETAITGHGVPMYGDKLRDGLRVLARDFDTLAIPPRGRYVRRPAITDAHGVVAVPPEVADPWANLAIGFGAGLATGLVIAAVRRRRKEQRRLWKSLDLY